MEYLYGIYNYIYIYIILYYIYIYIMVFVVSFMHMIQVYEHVEYVASELICCK